MRPDLDLGINLPRVPHFLEITTTTDKKDNDKKELIQDTHTKITEKLRPKGSGEREEVAKPKSRNVQTL